MGASGLCVGRPGLGALPRPTARPSGVRPGPATHWLKVRGVWAWGAVTSPTARTLASWLCALWGRHEGAWGGRLLPACGASGFGRSPTPKCPSLGRAAGARYPLAMGAGAVGVGTRHLPHSPRSCELTLRAVGAAGGRLGWAPYAWVWGVRGQALSHARPPVLRERGWGPLPTGCGCGGCGRGDPSPNPQRALLRAGFARCRGGTRAPGGGALACVWGAGVVRPPRPEPPSLGRAAGARYPMAVGAGAVGMGTRHRPHSARSCELALRAVRAARGCRGGGLLPACGVPGLCPLPGPNPRPWGVRPGPATHWLWVRGPWAWGPVRDPTARALASWLCALGKRHQGARGGGGASCLCVGRPGLGALSRPTARPWGARPVPATHWLCMRGVWA